MNQLLLKGTNLRNTKWCIAFVVFTGNDTRLMMNSKEGKPKLSAVERQLNTFVWWILVLQLVLCLALGLMTSFWNQEGTITDNFYIPFEFMFQTEGVLSFFRYFLLLNTLLPISLFVSLEGIKFG